MTIFLAVTIAVLVSVLIVDCSQKRRAHLAAQRVRRD
jgi:hypothetical protein